MRILIDGQTIATEDFYRGIGTYMLQVSNIIKHCDANNIPAATNLASAEIMILALDRGDLDWRLMYRENQ